MPFRHFELCILGQGLAGTTLAWTAHLRGKTVVIIDAPVAPSASRIAAGLLTPITGPKLAPTWNWEICRPVAETFFQSVARTLNASIFATQPALHLFRSEEELQRFEQRLNSPLFRQLTALVLPSEFNPLFGAPWGGFEMPTAARLDVTEYLNLSRHHFQSSGRFIEAKVDLQTEVEMHMEHVRLPHLQIEADHFVLCQGFTPESECWFRPVRFNPAKGEVLSLHLPGLNENRVVHAGGWLAPMPNQSYRLGSTFEWKHLNTEISLQAREELLERMKTWYAGKFEVNDQLAAIRPTMHDFKPVIGKHPEFHRLGILNGLGTRGSLLAPWLSAMLLDHLDFQSPLPADLDVERWFR